MLKAWTQVVLLNLALTAVGLRAWLFPWPAPGLVALLHLRVWASSLRFRQDNASRRNQALENGVSSLFNQKRYT